MTTILFWIVWFLCFAIPFCSGLCGAVNYIWCRTIGRMWQIHHTCILPRYPAVGFSTPSHFNCPPLQLSPGRTRQLCLCACWVHGGFWVALSIKVILYDAPPRDWWGMGLPTSVWTKSGLDSLGVNGRWGTNGFLLIESALKTNDQAWRFPRCIRPWTGDARFS